MTVREMIASLQGLKDQDAEVLVADKDDFASPVIRLTPGYWDPRVHPLDNASAFVLSRALHNPTVKADKVAGLITPAILIS